MRIPKEIRSVRHDDDLRIGLNDGTAVLVGKSDRTPAADGTAVALLHAPARLDAADVAREIARIEATFNRSLIEDRDVLDDVIRQAKSVGNLGLLARGWCLLGRFLLGRGKHEAALEAARAGLTEIAALDQAAHADLLPTHAELLRLAGDTVLKLGRVAEAFPLLEESVALAERAVLEAGSVPAARVRAMHALVRSLNNLGAGLLDVREIETSIEILRRTATVTGDSVVGVDDGIVDDMLLAHTNLVRALHERARRSREAGQLAPAAADLHEARALLDAFANAIERAPRGDIERISAYGRQAYFHGFGEHLLLAGQPAQALQMFVRQIDEAAHEPHGGMHDLTIAIGRTGMAQAMLALDAPHEALAQCALALESFTRCDDVGERAAVLLVRASALRRLGQHEAAYRELEAYHAMGARLQASAVQRYARYVNAKLGLERALAEIDSHRRVAVTLETLGRIGQEITANLDAATVVKILHRHVGTLLEARSFAVWLVDEAAQTLVPAIPFDDGRPPAAEIALDDLSSPAVRCVRERSELVIPDRALGGPARAARCSLYAPFCLGERVLGVLSIQSSRVDAYGENERSIVRTLCTYGAIALDNAAAYREVGRVVSELRATQSELAVRTAEYERLSMTDALTGLPNRRHFIARATVEVAEARRNGSLLAVAMFDIDHFKTINDSHGHFVGDRVLQRIAGIAKDALRPDDFIARIGGEEFALLLPGAGPAEALGIAERIRAAFEKTADYLDGLVLVVTSSFGVASFTAGTDSFDDAFARADRALYRAKQNGRNRVCCEVRD